MRMPSRLAPAFVLALVFAVSRLEFEPVSTGVGGVSLHAPLSRAIDAVEGRRFDDQTLGNLMVLLDPELLLHDLGRSLWHLHSQPPLFNLLVAGMLRLPGDFARNYQWLNWAFSAILFATTFRLMLIAGAGRWTAVVATALFMLNPNGLWMESAVYYGVPLAAMLALSAFLFHRALVRGSLASLAAASILVVLLPLTRAFFTTPWCVLALGFFAMAFARMHGRRARAILATALPLLLVVAFQLKQYAVFGQFLGSSWFGCNLTAMTAGMGAGKEKALAAGKVSPLVNVYRNAPANVYLPYFPMSPTGIPALDQTHKSTGQPNYNHAVYLPAGRQYLKDTLYLITHNPDKYLLNVVNSVYLFSGYEIGLYFTAPSEFVARHSWRAILAPLIGFPLIAAAIVFGIHRLRRSGEAGPLRMVRGFMLFNVLYVAAVSCLLEKGEAALYRYQIDAFLWTFLAVEATAFLARWRNRAPLVAGPQVLSDVRP